MQSVKKWIRAYPSFAVAALARELSPGDSSKEIHGVLILNTRWFFAWDAGHGCSPTLLAGISPCPPIRAIDRSEEHTSELQSLMRNSYAVFCLKKKKNNKKN